jgi:hypothetical protein
MKQVPSLGKLDPSQARADLDGVLVAPALTALAGQGSAPTAGGS